MAGRGTSGAPRSPSPPQGPPGSPPVPAPGRRTTLAILYAFLFALGLGVTAGLLQQFQSLPPPSHGQGALPYGAEGYVLLVVIISAVLCLLLFRLFRRGKGTSHSVPSGAALLSYAVTVLVVIVVLALLSAAVYPPGSGPHATNTTKGGGGTTGPGGGSNTTGGNGTIVGHAPGTPPPPVPTLLLAITAGIIATLVIVPLSVTMLTRRRSLGPVESGPPPELLHRLEQARAALQAGAPSEARDHIIQAYGVLISALRTRGMAEIDVSTPLEIEDRMSRTLGLSSPSAQALRTMFEEARYSPHEITEANRTVALSSLEVALGELRAARPRRTGFKGSDLSIEGGAS
jgi:hypothetical protein